MKKYNGNQTNKQALFAANRYFDLALRAPIISMNTESLWRYLGFRKAVNDEKVASIGYSLCLEHRASGVFAHLAKVGVLLCPYDRTGPHGYRGALSTGHGAYGSRAAGRGTPQPGGIG